MNMGFYAPNARRSWRRASVAAGGLPIPEKFLGELRSRIVAVAPLRTGIGGGGGGCNLPLPMPERRSRQSIGVASVRRHHQGSSTGERGWVAMNGLQHHTTASQPRSKHRAGLMKRIRRRPGGAGKQRPVVTASAWERKRRESKPGILSLSLSLVGYEGERLPISAGRGPQLGPRLGSFVSFSFDYPK